MYQTLFAVLLRRAVLFPLVAAISVSAQSLAGVAVPKPPQQIVQAIDEHSLVSLRGNVSPLALVSRERGRVPDTLPQGHILIMLKRSPRQEAALEQFMREQYDPHSANFHHWLTPEQFGALFGPSANDIAELTHWLGAHGFTVNRVAPGRTFVDFSGTAGQVAAAFHTEIHYYQFNGKQYYANASPPMIPAALAPLVSGFRALNNFYPHPMSSTPGVARLDKSTGRWSRIGLNGHLTDGAGVNATYLVGPRDFAKIYGLDQVWSQNIDVNGTAEKLIGTGETIGIVGDTDLNTADIQNFRNQFGLNTVGPNGSVNVDHPPATVCAAPNPNANDPEGYIDVEWAGSTAPDASIDFVTCASQGNTAGADLAATYIVNDAAHAARDSVLSTSWGYCEATPTSETDQFYVTLWQQAAAEGITVVVAAGDAGPAECDEFTGDPYAAHGLAISAEASTPYNIAVGGTDFSDVFTGTTPNYWGPSNGSGLESALSYIPETTWNDNCASPLVLAAFGGGFVSSSGPGGFCTYASSLPRDPNTGLSPYFNHFAGPGGLSTISARPSWQMGVTGIPEGGGRAVPDLSMFASSGETWGHSLLFCDSYYLPAGVTCDFSDPNNLYDNEDGGTSFTAPAFAGIMALIDQKSGERQGQADNILYLLAATQYVSGGSTNSSQPSLATCAAYLGTGANPSCYFHDISGTPNPDPATQAQTPFLIGNISVPCTGAATAPGVYTGSSADPASNSKNCYGYQITVTQNGSSLTTTPDYYGVVSASAASNSPAYSAAPGYDLATGLGSPNVAALVNAPEWSPLTITTSSLPQAAIGTKYSQTLAASGGVPLYTWSIASGSLPAGLSLNPATGVISGTPTVTGLSSFVVQVADARNPPVTATASLTIGVPGVGVGISPASLTIPFAGSGTLAITLTPEGGFSGSVSLSCGTLPKFLSCSFAPPSPVALAPNGGPVTDVLTIRTAAVETAGLRQLLHPGKKGGAAIYAAASLWLPAGFAGLLGFDRRRRRAGKLRKSRFLWLLAAVVLLGAGLAGAAGLGGCGGHSSNTTPDGSYNVTVTATYSGGTRAANATVLIE